VPAFPEKDEVTEKRNVVVESDPLSALGATGGGVDDRFTKGNAIDAHIQETADGQTEEHCEKKSH
jgi:hypothetical protein